MPNRVNIIFQGGISRIRGIGDVDHTRPFDLHNVRIEGGVVRALKAGSDASGAEPAAPEALKEWAFWSGEWITAFKSFDEFGARLYGIRDFGGEDRLHYFPNDSTPTANLVTVPARINSVGVWELTTLPGISDNHFVSYIIIPYNEHDDAGRWEYFSYHNETGGARRVGISINANNKTKYIEVWRTLERDEVTGLSDSAMTPSLPHNLYYLAGRFADSRMIIEVEDFFDIDNPCTIIDPGFDDKVYLKSAALFGFGADLSGLIGLDVEYTDIDTGTRHTGLQIDGAGVDACGSWILLSSPQDYYPDLVTGTPPATGSDFAFLEIFSLSGVNITFKDDSNWDLDSVPVVETLVKRQNVYETVTPEFSAEAMYADADVMLYGSPTFETKKPKISFMSSGSGRDISLQYFYTLPDGTEIFGPVCDALDFSELNDITNLLVEFGGGESGLIVYLNEGVELVTNGVFDTDSDWTKTDGAPSGWSIAGNRAQCNGTQTATSDIEQGITIPQWSIATVVYTISNYSVGSLTPYVGGTAGKARTANGTYTDLIVVGSGGSPQLEFRASATFVGDLDTVSVTARHQYERLVVGPFGNYLSGYGGTNLMMTFRDTDHKDGRTTTDTERQPVAKVTEPNKVFMAETNHPFDPTFSQFQAPNDETVRAITPARLAEEEQLQSYAFYLMTDKSVRFANRVGEVVTQDVVDPTLGVLLGTDNQPLFTLVSAGVVFVGTDKHVYFLSGRQLQPIDLEQIETGFRDAFSDLWTTIHDIEYHQVYKEVWIATDTGLWVLAFERDRGIIAQYDLSVLSEHPKRLMYQGDAMYVGDTEAATQAAFTKIDESGAFLSLPWVETQELGDTTIRTRIQRLEALYTEINGNEVAIRHTVRTLPGTDSYVKTYVGLEPSIPKYPIISGVGHQLRFTGFEELRMISLEMEGQGGNN